MESISLSDEGEEDINPKEKDNAGGDDKDVRPATKTVDTPVEDQVRDATCVSDPILEHFLMPGESRSSNDEDPEALVAHKDIKEPETPNAIELHNESSCPQVALADVDCDNSTSHSVKNDDLVPILNVSPSIPKMLSPGDKCISNVNEGYSCTSNSEPENSSVLSTDTGFSSEHVSVAEKCRPGDLISKCDKKEGLRIIEFFENDENLIHSDENIGNSKVLTGETENDELQLTNRILRLEEERGKITKEVMEKEILTLKLEKENSSLRTELSQNEVQWAAKMSECETRHKQSIDQMALKLSEVKTLTWYIILRSYIKG